MLLDSMNYKYQDGEYLSFLERGRENQPFHLPWVKEKELCRRMRWRCLDLMLLRQWEWKSREEFVLGSRSYYAMIHVLHLQQLGQVEKAVALMACVDLLLSQPAGLTEPHGVLYFLHLLSQKTCSLSSLPRKPDGWLYDIYSRSGRVHSVRRCSPASET